MASVVNYQKRKYNCMNCRKEITTQGTNIYTKRFCSDKCKNEYFTK